MHENMNQSGGQAGSEGNGLNLGGNLVGAASPRRGDSKALLADHGQGFG